MNAIPPMVPSPVAASIPVMTDAALALTLGLLLLAPMAIAGVALIAVAAIVFAFIGASFTGSLGPAEIVLHLAGKPWSVLGFGSFLLHGLDSAAPQPQLAVLFEFLSVAMLVLLPWGSGADRWRLAAGCASAAIVAAIVFPLAAHWIWAGGWLGALGTNFGVGVGFLDAGGAGTVHLLGG